MYLNETNGLGRIPVPRAGPGEDGALQMVWEDDKHHVSFDVLPNGKVEWFRSNKETGDFCGEEDLDFQDIPANVVKLLVVMGQKRI